jgi:peptide/nickel transport system substrate-binding protein
LLPLVPLRDAERVNAMGKLTRWTALLSVVIVLFACTTDGGKDEPIPSTARTAIRGGTLELAMTSDFQAALDPAKEYDAGELYRCCLLRTLLSYEGVPTAEGGNELRPDIAAEIPTVSSDGLTWTFQIRPGVHYAPPFEEVEVTAQDFVRALEREGDPRANVGGYSFYYSAIEGFDQYSGGEANSISGVSAPDAYTMVIRVTEPTGDLGYRFALPATAPIPPNAGARVGAADGHERDYGRFLVASGPYMFEGSELMDFSRPAEEQRPASGYVPGRSLVLVRNPAWDRATDDLRPAYLDRIEIVFGGETADLQNQVRSGDIDLVFEPSVPPNLLREYVNDPALTAHLHIHPADSTTYLEFNVLQPPFDDVHVRKAVNLAIDKAGLRTLLGGASKGELTGHIMPDSLENGLLDTYDPYGTPGSAGDVSAAREEMARSAYGDAEGMCVDDVCHAVLAFTINQRVYQDQAVVIAENLGEIGITLDVKALAASTMYSKCADPSAHMGICLALAWYKDYADGYTFATPLFGSVSIFPSCCNDPLVGASEELLRENGYDPILVPNVDPQLEECARTVGEARFECWAALDQLLMETVVPWVPWLSNNGVWITSERVSVFSFDQSNAMPALDRLSIDPNIG